MSAGQLQQRRTFRQRGTVVLGVVCMLGCLVMSATSLSSSLAFAGSMLAVACWVFVLLVRPSLQLSVDGVHVNNPVRRTTIPWPLVQDCLGRWNLQVDTGAQVVTAWAISASSQRYGRSGQYAGGLFGRGLRSAPDESAPVQPPVSAASVARYVELGRQEWDEEVASGQLVVEGPARVVRAWDWLDVALLLAPLGVAVAGRVIG